MLLPKVDAGATRGAVPASGWPATVVVWGPGDATSMHAHHAIHLVLAREGKLRIATKAERWEARGVYVPGHLPHAIDARGSEVVIVFVEPESEAGEGLYRSLGRELRLFDDEQVEAWLPRGTAVATVVEGWLRTVFADLGVVPWRPTLHPGVARVLTWLRSAPPELEPKRDELAAIAKLSPSRFSHAFKESVGLPLRTYLLWQRLLRAAAALHETDSLSEAAHRAGFADAAHMSRTFRRMFGSTPTEMLVRSRNVQDGGGREKED